LIQAGRLREAQTFLDDAAAVRASLQDFSTNQNGGVIGRTNLLIAAGRAREAPAVLKAFVVKDATVGSVSVSRLQRAVQAARVELALSHPRAAIEALQELRQMADASLQRSFLKSYEADADYLEGKAYGMQGRADVALPLLRQAHAQYVELFDERLSLNLADSKVALANALLALGQPGEARRLAGEAAAIHAAHRQVGAQYMQPMRALKARLERS
jgi:tetratricopeptide (TPR) repeat protein